MTVLQTKPTNDPIHSSFSSWQKSLWILQAFPHCVFWMPQIPFAFEFECKRLNDLCVAELAFSCSEIFVPFLLKMPRWQFDWTFQNKKYLYFSVWMTEWSFEWLMCGQIAIWTFTLKLKRKRKLRDTECTFPQTLLDGSSSACSTCNYTVHGLMRSDPSIMSNTNKLITPLCIAGCWMLHVTGLHCEGNCDLGTSGQVNGQVCVLLTSVRGRDSHSSSSFRQVSFRPAHSPVTRVQIWTSGSK